MSKQVISEVLLEVANAIETGNFGKKLKVGLTTLGSEHGFENLLQGAILAKNPVFDIVLIGKGHEDFESYEAKDEIRKIIAESMRKISQEMLED